MPAPWMLATFAELNSWMKGSLDAAAFTTVGETILKLVTRDFGQHCHRVWDKGAVVDLFSRRGRAWPSSLIGAYPESPLRDLWLRRPPVNTAATLEVFDDPTRAYGIDTKIAAASYVVDTHGHVELDPAHLSTFKLGLNNIKATYTGGYLTADGTTDLTDADLIADLNELKGLALMQAAFIFQRRAELGVTGRALAGGQLVFEKPVVLLPIVQSGLEHFRRRRLAC